jgi:hypothetical protein
VPGCHLSVVGGVLAERGEHDAILEFDAADPKGLEQGRGTAATGLRVERSTSRWLLRRSKVGDLKITTLAVIRRAR